MKVGYYINIAHYNKPAFFVNNITSDLEIRRTNLEVIKRHFELWMAILVYCLFKNY